MAKKTPSVSLPTRLAYRPISNQPTSSLLKRQDKWTKAERIEVMTALDELFTSESQLQGHGKRFDYGWQAQGGYKSKLINFHQSGPLAGSFTLNNPDANRSMWTRRDPELWGRIAVAEMVGKLYTAFPNAEIEFIGKDNNLRVRPAGRRAVITIDKGDAVYKGLLEVVRALTAPDYSNYRAPDRRKFARFLVNAYSHYHIRMDGRKLDEPRKLAGEVLGEHYSARPSKDNELVVKTIVGLWCAYEDVAKFDWRDGAWDAFMREALEVIADNGKEIAQIAARRVIRVYIIDNQYVVKLKTQDYGDEMTRWAFTFAKDALEKIEALENNPSYSAEALKKSTEYVRVLEAAVSELRQEAQSIQEAWDTEVQMG